MALNSTIYKADLHISNLNTHYYEQHKLTLAKHPSETDERMMVRLLAFCLYAQEGLAFGKGVSGEQEAALYLKDLTGAFNLWIEVGLPEERRIRKACGLANQVVVVAYGKAAVKAWWQQNQEDFTKRNNLTIIQLPAESTQALAAMADRNMLLNCTIDGTQISFSGENNSLIIEPVSLYCAKQNLFN